MLLLIERLPGKDRACRKLYVEVVSAMKVAILALDGLFDTGLIVTLDALSLANNFSATQMGGIPRFDVTVVGVRKRVRSRQGLSMPVKDIKPSLKPDWVIVPALGVGTAEQLIVALERKDVIDAKMQLQKWHAKGVHIGASCIGSFLLADAGLLDGCEATTTWWLAPFFRQRYPNVSLDEVPDACAIGSVGYGRRADGASRSCALVDTPGQPGIGRRCLTLHAGGYTFLAGSVHHSESSGAG